MSEEKMSSLAYTGGRAPRDPGAALIIIYVSVVAVLLLCACLRVARAEGLAQTKPTWDIPSSAREKSSEMQAYRPEDPSCAGFDAMETTVSPRADTKAAKRDTANPRPMDGEHDKGSLRGDRAPIAGPSEAQMLLGVLALACALLLARDRGGR